MDIEKYFSCPQFGRRWGGCLLGILQKDFRKRFSTGLALHAFDLRNH